MRIRTGETTNKITFPGDKVLEGGDVEKFSREFEGIIEGVDISKGAAGDTIGVKSGVGV